MKTGARVNNKISDDRGVSLVELIVVISIMAIMTGLISIGASLMFTRDASYVSTRIDDGLSEARMYAMSKAGKYTYILHIGDNPSDSTVTIKDDGSFSKTVKLDKSVLIDITGSGLSEAGPGKDIYIVFSKSNGKVNSVTVGEPGDDAKAEGVYKITVTSKKNSSKVEEVTLIAATGRHYAEKKTDP